MSIELQIFGGTLKATFHHHLHQQNNRQFEWRGSDPAQQEAAPEDWAEVTAPLCAAAVAMHGPPPST